LIPTDFFEHSYGKCAFVDFGSAPSRLFVMVWHVIGITVAKAAVLLTTLQGARRPTRISATMVLSDAAWWQPELTHLYVSPVHSDNGQSCLSAKEPPHASEAKEDASKEEFGQKMHQQPVSFHQVSALVLLHLVINVMQFLHWCIGLLTARRRLGESSLEEKRSSDRSP